jgi:hypothetical protein
MNLTRLIAMTAIAFALAIAFACSGPPKGELTRKSGIVALNDSGTESSQRASPGSFQNKGVSLVFEKHCGTLDCHGTPERNLRIYSQDGLRLPNDAGNVPGTGATTNDEVNANYQSIMTLEPEQTNAVIAGADPLTLLIMKKPLGIEKHKGGDALISGDDAETCIRTWLTEDVPDHPVDKARCTSAGNFPLIKN